MPLRACLKLAREARHKIMALKVAFDTSSTRGRKTGIGSYTESLICALKKFVPQINVLEMADGATADQRTPNRILREQFVIPRFAARSRAEILHLTGFACPFRASCPVVLDAHDMVGVLFAENFPLAARFYWSKYLPFTLRFAQRLIVPSESAKKDVVRLAKIPAGQIHVIPHGRNSNFGPILDQQVLKEVQQRLNLPSDFLLFVSTLEPRKGVDTLIDAFARIAGRIPEDLVIVGRRGWYWEKLVRNVQEVGLENRVHFLDYIADKDLPPIYNLAKVFVFPSRYEGFGLTVLEAMSCGTPVISSNASSLPEVAGDAAVLVPPDDAEQLADEMMRVTADPSLRQELRMRGLEQAQKFSWERAAEETVRVYESLDANKF